LEERSAGYSKFIESMAGGQGFDLAALKACDQAEQEALVERLAPAAAEDWRHVEALLAIGTPDAVAAARAGLTGEDRLLRLYTAGQLHARGETEYLEGVVAEAIDNAGPDDGLKVALDLAVRFPTRATNQALLDGTIDADREQMIPFGNALLYAVGATQQRNGPYNAFLWELATMERAERIPALRDMLAKSPADISGLDWGEGVAAPAGPVRLVLRWLMRLLCLAVAGAIGWHIYALANLPDRPFDAIYASPVLTVLAGLSAILFLLWFDGRLRGLPLFVIGVAALALCGLSMRWIDTSAHGLREHWSGLELHKAALAGDLCYRVDGGSFALRGAIPEEVFTYSRGWWPSAFDEETFKRYFFSDLPMAAQPDGWKCHEREGF
jgi:hypothetical protein